MRGLGREQRQCPGKTPDAYHHRRQRKMNQADELVLERYRQDNRKTFRPHSPNGVNAKANPESVHLSRVQERQVHRHLMVRQRSQNMLSRQRED